MKIVLQVTAGPNEGTRFEFDRHETLLVGRGSSARLRLRGDKHFSRHHFLLELLPPRCFLRDLGSTNGTMVNGARVAEAYLSDGDVISGGRTKMVISLHTEVEETVEYVPPPEAGTQTAAPRPSAPASAPTSESIDLPGEPGASSIHVAPGYEVVRKLGQGGMGVVYLARVSATGRPVALKVMVPESAASERGVQLFLREVSVLSRLDHPRIVRFHETGFGNGQFYFAMEYVEAIEAEGFLTGLGVPARVRAACGLVCQVLAGLEYAHGQSFVHRDVKPRNILVSREGKSLGAKLADFGLAKNFENAGFSGITRAGQAVGTLAYMAPEQSVDARLAIPESDLYSTGATLYRFLTGHPPHHFPRGKDPILVILEDDPVDLRERCPEVSAGLAELVHRAIARDPSDRFATAAEMRQALLPHARGTA